MHPAAALRYVSTSGTVRLKECDFYEYFEPGILPLVIRHATEFP